MQYLPRMYKNQNCLHLIINFQAALLNNFLNFMFKMEKKEKNLLTVYYILECIRKSEKYFNKFLLYSKHFPVFVKMIFFGFSY